MSALKQPKIGPGIILPGTTIGGGVGTFNADFILWNRDKTESRALNGLVDTGSAYTLIPATILEELGVERLRSRTFNLADGTKRELCIGRVDMELEGETDIVPVVFGTDPHRILLGAIALETFVLVADAANQRLIPGELPL